MLITPKTTTNHKNTLKIEKTKQQTHQNKQTTPKKAVNGLTYSHIFFK